MVYGLMVRETQGFTFLILMWLIFHWAHYLYRIQSDPVLVRLLEIIDTTFPFTDDNKLNDISSLMPLSWGWTTLLGMWGWGNKEGAYKKEAKGAFLATVSSWYGHNIVSIHRKQWKNKVHITDQFLWPRHRTKGAFIGARAMEGSCRMPTQKNYFWNSCLIPIGDPWPTWCTMDISDVFLHHFYRIIYVSTYSSIGSARKF